MSTNLPRNVKLTIEYDGTDYHGWQRQANALTIQQVMEDGIERIVGHPVTLLGSGRTDAGVHALGQVANFRTTSRIPAEQLHQAINSVLPPDIAVLRAEDVADEFHARYSARSKTYRYGLLCREVRPVIGARYVAWHRWPLDMAQMSLGAAVFLGEHDFSTFETESDREGSVRTVTRFDIEESSFGVPPLGGSVFGVPPLGGSVFGVPPLGGLVSGVSPSGVPAGERVDFTVASNGFVYNMVRAMVGTLIEVGAGRRSPEDIAQLLSVRDRRLAGATAPAKGLCLMKVEY